MDGDTTIQEDIIDRYEVYVVDGNGLRFKQEPVTTVARNQSLAQGAMDGCCTASKYNISIMAQVNDNFNRLSVVGVTSDGREYARGQPTLVEDQQSSYTHCRLKVENVDYNRLVAQPALFENFSRAVKGKLAQTFNVSIDRVIATFSAGSVVVNASILGNGNEPNNAAVALENIAAREELASGIVAALEALPGIRSVTTGTIQVQSSSIVVEDRELTTTTTSVPHHESSGDSLITSIAIAASAALIVILASVVLYFRFQRLYGKPPVDKEHANFSDALAMPERHGAEVEDSAAGDGRRAFGSLASYEASPTAGDNRRTFGSLTSLATQEEAAGTLESAAGDNRRAFGSLISHASQGAAQPYELRQTGSLVLPTPEPDSSNGAAKLVGSELGQSGLPVANISLGAAGADGGDERIRCGWSACMYGPAPGYLIQPCVVTKCKKCGLAFHQTCYDIHRTRGLPSFAGNPRCPRPLKSRKSTTPLRREQSEPQPNVTESSRASSSSSRPGPSKTFLKSKSKLRAEPDESADERRTEQVAQEAEAPDEQKPEAPAQATLSSVAEEKDEQQATPKKKAFRAKVAKKRSQSTPPSAKAATRISINLLEDSD